MSDRPLWREGFDRGERFIGSRLEELVLTRTFNDLLVRAFRGQSAVYGLFERQTRTVLHFWNLPTRSDITRLRAQVATLSGEVQQLAEKVEEAQRPRRPAKRTPAGGSAAKSRRAKS